MRLTAEEILAKVNTDEPLTEYEKGFIYAYFDGIHNGDNHEYNLGFVNGIIKLEKDMEAECQQ